MSEVKMPSKFDLMWPTVKALKDLGGSGTNSDILARIIENEGFGEEIVQKSRPNQNKSVLSQSAAWARHHLKLAGALESPSVALWKLTSWGESMDEESLVEVRKRLKEAEARKSSESRETPAADLMSAETSDEAEVAEELGWEVELLDVLYDMPPAAFERLCRLLLERSGLVKVEVMGRTGDGGLDGVGILRMNLVSFRVHFQCKRYRGSVSNSAIRDFRGAIEGRGQGIFITTGQFTKAAQEEANRDGAKLIDLIDGEMLCSLLYKLKLGVSERVAVDRQWFMGI